MGKYIMMLAGLGLIAFIGIQFAADDAEQDEIPTQEVAEAPVPAPEPEPEPILLQLDPESLQRVRNATRDTDPVVRWQSVKFLVDIEDDQAANILFTMLRRDGNPENRKNVVALLSSYNEPTVTRELIRTLKDTDNGVRVAVLDGLGKIGDYSAAESIGRMIHDSNETVRLKAIHTLDLLEKRRNEEISTAKEKHEKEMRDWEEKVRQQKQQQTDKEE